MTTNVITQFNKYLSDKGIEGNEAIVKAAYAVLNGGKPAKAGGEAWWLGKFKDGKFKDVNSFVTDFIETAKTLDVANKWAIDYENDVTEKTVAEISALFAEYVLANNITDPAEMVKDAYVLLGGGLTPIAGGVDWWVGQNLTVEQLAAKFIDTAGTMREASAWANGFESGVPGEPGEPGEPSSLTEALEKLDAANKAVDSFVEKAPALDSTVTAVGGSIKEEAGEASNAQIKTYYGEVAAAAAAVSSTPGFDKLSKTNQDSVINNTKAMLQTNVNIATDAAADGMTALLNTLTAREEALTKANTTATEVDATYTEETTVFGAVNTTLTVGDTNGSDVNFVGTEFGIVNNAAGVLSMNTKYADLVDGKWVLTAAGEALNGGKGIARLDDLYAAHQAKATADAAVKAAKTAIENAVKDIILLETGAFAVDNVGSSIKLDGFSDLTATNISVFEKEEDSVASGAVAGTAAVYTVDLSLAAADNNQTIKIGGQDVYTSDTDGKPLADIIAGVVATATVTIAGVEYTIADAGDNKVTLTAKPDAQGVYSAVASTDTIAVVNGDGSNIEATLAPSTEGVATVAGSTNPTTGVDVEKADALAIALESLKGFTELVELFEEARDLNTNLLALEKAAADAKAAIVNSAEDADAPGMGISLIDASAANVGFTAAKDDLYLFNAKDDAGTGISVAEFTGKDMIFFGKDFTGGLQKITDETKSNGDAGKLEIFWVQKGTAVELYVETETFGGSVSGVGADVVKVTLAGVTGDDLSLDNDGFLTIA